MGRPVGEDASNVLEPPREGIEQHQGTSRVPRERHLRGRTGRLRAIVEVGNRQPRETQQRRNGIEAIRKGRTPNGQRRRRFEFGSRIEGIGRVNKASKPSVVAFFSSSSLISTILQNSIIFWE